MTTVTVFDAYGTLFDPHGLTQRLEAEFPGAGSAISTSWREAQLRYTWLRSLMDRWTPFDAVTIDALRWACQLHGVDPDQRSVDALLEAYRSLPAYPDVAPVLGVMPGRLAILSNGSRPMLEAACAAAGIGARLKAILSSDDVRVYKPDPRIYRLATERFGVAPNEVRFVSGNGWDCAGATAAGFSVVHISRGAEPPERLGAEPPPTIVDLRDLLDGGVSAKLSRTNA